MTENNVTKGNLVEMIDYQTDAIISKTLIENDGGTVTLFAFGKGSSISEHTASHEAMAQILEGKIEFTIAGQPYQAEQGEMLIMPADIPHGLTALEDSKMLLTMVE